jgi:putative nucleotidyltransferase with HDIG domain
MGKLHYRTSYGQNVLRHSVEVAFLSQIIADQLGLDGTLARRCGFLHDIGKAMDQEMEGGHPKIGMDFARQHGEKVRPQRARRREEEVDGEEDAEDDQDRTATSGGIVGGNPGEHSDLVNESTGKRRAAESAAQAGMTTAGRKETGRESAGGDLP